MSEDETKKEEKKEEFEIVTVATETGLVVQNKKGEQISQLDLLVIIANDLNEVKKGLVG